MKQWLILLAAFLTAIVALLMAYGVVDEATSGFSGRSFDVKAIPHCCCQNDDWIFRSSTNYLIYAGAFLITFLACALTALVGAIRSSIAWALVAVSGTIITSFLLLKISLC